jgi:glycosyltransferase involved in cell wall biosynthesis
MLYFGVMSNPNLAIVVPAYNESNAILPTLRALYGQDACDTVKGDMLHVIVNNASTDDTRKVVEEFATAHPEFPLAIVDEPEKGTGRAVDTGFRYAIDRGFPVIGRTDADSLPLAGWTQSIIDNFAANESLHLLGGKRSPRTDDSSYRRRDRVLWPLGLAVGKAFSHGENGTGTVAGYNMATDTSAYLEVGGFPRTAIDEVDEDHEYEKNIVATYGPEAVGHSDTMHVQTSMRKLRELGYLGLARYRLAPTSDYRTSMAGSVDVRL